MLYVMFAAFVLTAGFSGCIGNNNYGPNMMNNSNNMMNREEADIRSVSIAVTGSTVTASITTDLDFDETLDTENITVKKAGGTIRILLYAFEHTAGGGSNIVNVTLGNVSDFKNGSDYTVIINNEMEKDEIIIFRFENNTLVTIQEAFVGNVRFEASGNDVIAVAEIPNAGKYDTVDEQNITKTRFDHENEMDIYVPIMIKSSSTDEKGPIYAKISIGQIDKLNNGRYFVEINGRDASFTIQNGTLMT
ncbi:hypothetical protein MmiAt1_08390 [Methanimicrococcus sp. At1]|uniref:DUF4382 domain-containing protein n=2 Tax=Methanimicrococcus hacksteinii TaxID=3028293 RepID=A0ABU3VPH3_9EURY|nr:hypothetical protein [Methanimicrococcus sp. At1]